MQVSGRALHLCDQNGFGLSERNPEIRAPGFNFGAYLKSHYFADLDQGMLLDIDLAEGMGLLRGPLGGAWPNTSNSDNVRAQLPEPAA